MNKDIIAIRLTQKALLSQQMKNDGYSEFWVVFQTYGIHMTPKAIYLETLVWAMVPPDAVTAPQGMSVKSASSRGDGTDILFSQFIHPWVNGDDPQGTLEGVIKTAIANIKEHIRTLT
jgi:hypothetical protein